MMDLLASDLHASALREGLPGIEVPVEVREEARGHVNPDPVPGAKQVGGHSSTEVKSGDRPRLEEMNLVLAVAVGCSRTHSKADVERGQKALTAALDSWKNNEPPERLAGLADPVEYKDELRQTHKLLEYAIGKPDPTDPEVVRYPVTVKLQDRKGKSVDRTIVFMVSLKSPIVIARDPYY